MHCDFALSIWLWSIPLDSGSLSIVVITGEVARGWSHLVQQVAQTPVGQWEAAWMALSSISIVPIDSLPQTALPQPAWVTRSQPPTSSVIITWEVLLASICKVVQTVLATANSDETGTPGLSFTPPVPVPHSIYREWILLTLLILPV